MVRLPLLLCFALHAVPAAAQTASVSGTIVDQTGAALPGATVQLIGPTNAVTTSGPGGQYTFRDVGAGTYVIEVRLVGFAPAVQDGVTMAGANVQVPPITLALASINDVVVVTATRSEASLIHAPVTM